MVIMQGTRAWEHALYHTAVFASELVPVTEYKYTDDLYRAA